MNEQIVAILKEIQPVYDFENEADFIENGYLDSFDIVALVTELEGTFSVVISALDILPENFNSVANIAALVKRSPQKSRA